MDEREDYTLERVRKIYSFWGRYSALYAAQDFFTFLGRAGFLRDRAVASVGLSPGDAVLEVACGTGRNFRHLVKRVGPEGRVVGLDYSPEMLGAARRLCEKRGWANIELVQGDAAALAVEGDNFDGALSVLGISAIPDYENALRRIMEKLRPGAALAVCDARPFAGRLSIFNALIKSVYGKWAGWDYRKEIPGKMKEIFGNVNVESFNFGTMRIAVAAKRG